jgi:methyl-accepting chemotaxis protein
MKSIRLDWNSLTTRLTVTFAVLLLVVTLAVTVFSVVRAKSSLEENLRTHGRILLSSMEMYAGDYLAGNDYNILQKYAEITALRESVVSYVVIVNTDGRIIAHTDHSREGKDEIDTNPALKGNTGITERLTRYKDTPVLEFTAPVNSYGMRRGTIRLALNYTGINRALRNLFLSIALAGLVMFGLAIIIVRTVTARLSSGLADLADRAGKFSEGEFGIEVPDKGYREVRSLGNAFNTMERNLRSLLHQVGDMGSQISTIFSQMLSVIQDQAASASQQAASVSEVTATMEELSRTSHQIAENAESVKNASAKTVEMAQHGTVLMRDGVGAMEQVRQRVGDIAKRNLFLGEKSQEIGKVMEIIKEIASEIHLLALNAAIESAAAGEHGRRFSVVASEVRRLAEKTRESTETIRSIISEIQAATGSSIQATDQGTREVDRSRETIRLSSTAFEEIIQMIEKTLESSTQISLATHQQTSANEQVVQAMRQVAEMVLVTAGHMKDLSGSSAKLKGMVEKFQEITGVFEL